MTKRKILIKLIAAFAAVCGVAGVASTGTAANSCHGTDGATINAPFNAAVGIVTTGCSYSKSVSGLNISGQGQANPAGVRQVCANLIAGANVTTTGMDAAANPIAGCLQSDATPGGGFVCDTVGCNAAVRFDTFVN
jgi:hypothetical protein